MGLVKLKHRGAEDARKGMIELPAELPKSAYEKTGAVIVRSNSINDIDQLLSNTAFGSKTRSLVAPPVVSQNAKLILDPPVVPVKRTWAQWGKDLYRNHPFAMWVFQTGITQGIGMLVAPGAGIACQCGCHAAKFAAGPLIGAGVTNAALVSTTHALTKN